MKAIEIKLYSFSELSKDIQDKVIEKLHDINTDFNWYEYVYDEHKELIKAAGFDVDKMYFSGFWSQGDGAMFEYSGLDGEILLPEFVATLTKLPEWKKQVLLNCAAISGKGKQSGNYYHEKSCSHSIYIESNIENVYFNINTFIESYQNEFEEFIEEKYENLCRDLYKALEKEYEYLSSREQIIETIESNEYTFEADGTMRNA